MYYQELIIDVCDKYDITIEERNIIYNLFDPNDFKKELAQHDINAINKKLSDKIYDYGYKLFIKKITQSYPFIGYLFNNFV